MLMSVQNICGMSVIDGPSFEELKRYNLHEIYQDAAKKKDIKVEVEEPSAESRAEEPASASNDIEQPASVKEESAGMKEESMDTA